MSHHDGPYAAGFFSFLVYCLEERGNSGLLVNCAAQRVERIYAVELKRLLIEVGPLERHDMRMEMLLGLKHAGRRHPDEVCSYFQQGISL